MAIRIPNLGTGNGSTGDNELKIRQDYNHNFEDQTNAASRLVGGAAGNLMEVGVFGLGGSAKIAGIIAATTESNNPNLVNGFYEAEDIIGNLVAIRGQYGTMLFGSSNFLSGVPQYAHYNSYSGNKVLTAASVHTFWTTQNATKDPNGFLKGASPIAEIYSDKMDLNQDATQQGNITFEKLGVGDYLVKGSLGFAQEGWYIETPKDANGNVLVAVVYEQLANNDLSIKTYAKKFDDETGDIVPNLLKPRDIPTGRFISLRLHELPKAPPVMPTENQPEV